MDQIIQASLVDYPITYKEPAYGSTTAFGMSQSDILLQTALECGFDDLLKYPVLMDYCFAWLSQDTLTARRYGPQALQDAKTWFLNTKIHVLMDYTVRDSPKFPCVVIGLNDSAEEQSTLGDVNYFPYEDAPAATVLSIVDSNRNSYNATTGKMTITNPNDIPVTTFMLVVDLETKLSYPIIDIETNSSFSITTGLSSPFKFVAVVPANNYLSVSLESSRFRESYSVLCCDNTKAQNLMYLYSVTKFCLLRYREAYIENRGFEQTRISSGRMSQDPVFGTEKVFNRSLQISGMIQEFWPKTITPKIQGLTVCMQIASNKDGPVPLQPGIDPWTTVNNPLRKDSTIPTPFVLEDEPF